MKRLSYIDSIKGLAIILVVIGHVANGYLRAGDRNALYTGIYNFIYAFHMPLFFTISGFLFAHAYAAADPAARADRLKRQILNLIFLYLLYSVLLWSTKMLFSSFVNRTLTIRDLLLIPIKPIELFWYLYVLILYYLAFGSAVLSRQKTAWLLLAALLLHGISYRLGNDLYFSAKNLCFYLLFFTLGIMLCEKRVLLEKRALLLAPLPVIIVLLILFWGEKTMLRSIPFVNTALGLSFSLFLFALFRQCRFLGESRILSRVGRYSLEIYVLHTYFVTFCRVLLGRLRVGNPLLLTFIASVVGVLAPIAVTLLCRRLGIYRCLFAPFKGQRAGKSASV